MATSKYTRIARKARNAHKQLCEDYKQYVKLHPGKRNCEIHRNLGLSDAYVKQFISHTTMNNVLYPAHEIKRSGAVYLPVKKTPRVERTSRDIVTSCLQHQQEIVECIREFIFEKYQDCDAVSNTDIAQAFGIGHDTLRDAHKDWFTWEIINTHCDTWGVKKIKYVDMTYEEKRHVTNVDLRKKYIIPIEPKKLHGYPVSLR